MLRPCALLCFVAGLAGLIWMGPAAVAILRGDLDIMAQTPWTIRFLGWISDSNLERQAAEIENEIMLRVWGIIVPSIVLCVLGAFLWRKGRHRREVRTATVSA